MNSGHDIRPTVPWITWDYAVVKDDDDDDELIINTINYWISIVHGIKQHPILYL